MATEPREPDPNPLVLDTNVTTWLTDPRSPRPDWKLLVVGYTPVLTFVTVGEILHGARKWSRVRQEAIEQMLAAYTTIPGTIGVARKFADLRARFYDRLPDNDLWMAACVLAQPMSVPLATDDGHFDEIAKEFPLTVLRPVVA